MPAITRGGLQKTSVALDPDQWVRLKEIARKEHTTTGHLLFKAIGAWLLGQEATNGKGPVVAP